MALVGNVSLLHKSPAKYLTGTVGFNDRANWNKPGMMRSRGDLTISLLWKYDAVPSGFFAGRAYFPPKQAGRCVTRNSFAINGAAAGAKGVPLSAASSLSIGATVIGGLIAGGVANATITINGTTVAAGRAAGQAVSTFTLSASAALGASAFGIASSTFTITGSVVPYAKAWGVATTIDTSSMTPVGVANAVLNALAAEYNTAGTIGAKINSAASGGVDYNALATAVWANATRTLTSGAAPTEAQIAAAVWQQVVENGLSAEEIVRLMAAALAGKVSGAGTGTVTFAGLDGLTPRIVGTVDASGNRTAVIVDGSP